MTMIMIMIMMMIMMLVVGGDEEHKQIVCSLGVPNL